MTPDYSEPILNQPIQTLDFSQQFRDVCRTLNFYTLKDLLKYKTKQLTTLPGFDLRMLSEYIGFMEKQHLGFYLN